MTASEASCKFRVAPGTETRETMEQMTQFQKEKRMYQAKKISEAMICGRCWPCGSLLCTLEVPVEGL